MNKVRRQLMDLQSSVAPEDRADVWVEGQTPEGYLQVGWGAIIVGWCYKCMRHWGMGGGCGRAVGRKAGVRQRWCKPTGAPAVHAPVPQLT